MRLQPFFFYSIPCELFFLLDRFLFIFSVRRSVYTFLTKDNKDHSWKKICYYAHFKVFVITNTMCWDFVTFGDVQQSHLFLYFEFVMGSSGATSKSFIYFVSLLFKNYKFFIIFTGGDKRRHSWNKSTIITVWRRIVLLKLDV